MAIQHINQVELSRRWRLSPRTLERWRYQGTGPQFLKVGGRVVYRLADIEAFEAEQLRATGATTGPPADRAAPAGAGVSVVSMARPIRIQPPRLSEIELCAWIAQAEPGAVLEYHRGYLALDRTAFGRFADTPARAALALLGSRAHDLAERGLVHLVQLRHGPEDYSYFAIARPRREGALPDFASLTITEEAA